MPELLFLGLVARHDPSVQSVSERIALGGPEGRPYKWY